MAPVTLAQSAAPPAGGVAPAALSEPAAMLAGGVSAAMLAEPTALRSRLRLVARHLYGRTVVTDMMATGQLAARLTGSGPTATVHLVAQAAGPLNGDSVHIEIDVGPGCRLQVRTSAATLALPSPSAHGGPALLRVTADVGGDSFLDWRPEPVVLADGANLDSRMYFRLAGSARLLAQEVLVLGRHGETGGRCRAALALDIGGEQVVRQQLDTEVLDRGGRWIGWSERVAATAVLVGPRGGASAAVSQRAAAVAPRPHVVVATATGPHTADVAEQLGSVLGRAGLPWSGQ